MALSASGAALDDLVPTGLGSTGASGLKEAPDAGVNLAATARFLRRVLIVAAVGALALLLWSVVDVLLLVFGAVLVAVLLRGLAEPAAQRTPLSDGWALVAVTLALLVAIGLAGALFGAEVRAQIA